MIRKKKKRRKLWNSSAFNIGSCDGLQVNRVDSSKLASRFEAKFSPYSTDTYHIKVKEGIYRRAGIQNRTAKVNRSKGTELNLYNNRIKGD